MLQCVRQYLIEAIEALLLGQAIRRPRSVAKETAMPLFLVERNFAEDVMLNDASASSIRHINDEIGIQWLYSFLSADKRKTYCLYEAPFADSIRRAAERAGLPADSVVEVSGLVLPDGSQARVPDEVRAD